MIFWVQGKPMNAKEFVNKYTGAKILSIEIIDGSEDSESGEAQYEFETDKGNFVG
jgi:hypothetical protein